MAKRVFFIIYMPWLLTYVHIQQQGRRPRRRQWWIISSWWYLLHCVTQTQRRRRKRRMDNLEIQFAKFNSVLPINPWHDEWALWNAHPTSMEPPVTGWARSIGVAVPAQWKRVQVPATNIYKWIGLIIDGSCVGYLPGCLWVSEFVGGCLGLSESETQSPNVISISDCVFLDVFVWVCNYLSVFLSE